jgi:hypothetical protein
MHPLHYLHPYYHDLASARRALDCVPKGEPLATYDEWFSAVAAQRPNATIDRTRGIEYLVYATDFTTNSDQARLAPAVAVAVARGEYRVVCRFGSVEAYEATDAR